MKKIIITVLFAVLLFGGVIGGVAWLTYPHRHGARWDPVERVWQYKGVPGSSLPVSYDLTGAKEYRDEQRGFSFHYPKSWRIERRAKDTVISFSIERNTLLWSPEQSPVLSLAIYQQPEVSCRAIRGSWERRFAATEQEQIEFFGGLPWLSVDLPEGHRERGISPYPRGVLELDDWCLIVRGFRPEIFRTFRSEGNKEVVEYDPPSSIVPFVQYGTPVDATLWPLMTFPEFGITFKHPPEWRNPQFVKSDTAEDIWRKEFYFGKQVGQHYTAAWTDKMIYLYIFTDNYNGWQEEGSIFFYPPISLDKPELALKALKKYFSFFNGSVVENSALGSGKVLRTFEDRGYGERNIAVTYFIPHANQKWNIYVVADLNGPVDLEAAGKPYISSADLRQILFDQNVQAKISLVDEIVRNISTAK